MNEATGIKGGVTGEKPAERNEYNHNFRNRFCGCGEDYDAHQEKGTMYQCLGLGTEQDGGCGEDWWHPECLVGLERKWYERRKETGNDGNGEAKDGSNENGQPKETTTASGAENGAAANRATVEEEARDKLVTDDPPLPDGFPNEDDFDHIICYKCVETNPWIKRYAGATGFLPAVFFKSSTEEPSDQSGLNPAESTIDTTSTSRKRKADDEDDSSITDTSVKRQRSSDDAMMEEKPTTSESGPKSNCTYSTLPPAPAGKLSVFLKEDFREHICYCPDCFPRLKPYPQLLEDEESYEPPISEDGDPANGGSVGTGSLLDRGEAALSNMDRVRAIEGVMVYNHLKDKVKSFLQPFAESGQAVGAEDIKAYFEKLRGDAEAMKAAAAGANEQGGSGDADHRKEQGGE
jgi:E3 ubiquitin-protein ligase UBR7